MRVGLVLSLEVGLGNEFASYAREVFVEEGNEVFGMLVEGGEVFGGEEKGTGKGFVEAGDGDEHELFAWPDVQVVGGDAEVVSL